MVTQAAAPESFLSGAATASETQDVSGSGDGSGTNVPLLVSGIIGAVIIVAAVVVLVVRKKRKGGQKETAEHVPKSTN